METNPKKFVYYPMRKSTMIQPDCPVYIYAYSLAIQKDGDAAFVQVRLVNRSDRCVHSVFLRIEGKDRYGNRLYELDYVPLVECAGKPHKAFGEEQPLFLPEGEVYSLNIQVLDVLFTDGMIWRKQNDHQILTPEQAGWETCTCGMKNPREAKSCAFCGASFLATEESLEVELAWIEETAEETEVSCESAVVAVPKLSEIVDEGPSAEHPGEIATEPESVQEEPEKVVTEELADPATEEVLAPASTDVAASEVATDEGEMSEDMPERELPGDSHEEETPEASTGEASETEEPSSDDNPGQWMQETERMLEEFRRRMLARERGEDPSKPNDQEEAETETPTDETPSKSGRGVMFWVLMVILLIILGAAAFFGVLYFKGYFG